MVFDVKAMINLDIACIIKKRHHLTKFSVNKKGKSGKSGNSGGYGIFWVMYIAFDC